MDRTCDVPSGGAAAERTWDVRALWLVAGLLAFRIAYAAVVPLDLAPDEAYYWDWSRQLDWSYFSKPPLVAWLIALSTRAAVASPLFVRLPAVVLGTAGLAWLWLLARRMYVARVAFWATLTAAATPGNAAMSLLMTIDAPLMFFWCATLYCVWRMLESGEARWVAAAVVCCGLGLLSKQTMLAVFPLVWLFALLSPPDRVHLRRPALFAWTVGSLSFLVPLLVWNNRHGWVTLQHTQEHFGGGDATLARHAARSLEYLASQGGVVSPVTYLLIGVVTCAVVPALRRLNRRVLFLSLLSLAPLLAVLGLSLLQRVQPNWPAPFYPTSVILVAAWAAGRLPAAPPLDRCRNWFHPGIGVGVACCLLAYLLPFAIPAAGLRGSPIDVTNRLHGWSELGREMGRLLDELPGAPPIVAATGREPVSPLAFYLPGQPRVYRFNPAGEVKSQHDLWPGPDLDRGDFVLVTYAEHPLPSEMQRMGRIVRRVGEIDVPIGPQRARRYCVWYAAPLDAPAAPAIANRRPAAVD